MHDRSAPAGIRRMAMLGNHMPRQCGIATFTTHLVDALGAAFPDLDCPVLAMTDPGKAYGYPARVRKAVPEGDLAAYHEAAAFVNGCGAEVLSVQHEYGIFGGRAGAHVLALLRDVRVPVVTTLHTILAEPDPAQWAVMDELTRLSERLVVMNALGVDRLRHIYRVPSRKIDLIPHGIPDVPFQGPGKQRLGLEGRPVLLTFGLLAPDKGIEYAIEAMPAVLARFPEAIYLVVGATHPRVKEECGEAYRQRLERRAEELGVAAAVRFENRYLSQEELNLYLGAADLYLTPYLKAEQVTSGTLAYAVGCGKAVISTPYLHAQELLGEGRGVLVPWRDGPAIAREVNALLGNDAQRLAMRRRAAALGRTMVWPAVAKSYLETFIRARADQAEYQLTRAAGPGAMAASRPSIPARESPW